MHNKSILSFFLNVKDTILKAIEIDKDKATATFTVKVASREDCRCGKCGRKSPVYDRGRQESRMWRSRDWNGVKIYLKADLVRVKCKKCGVVTQRVPWARLKSAFTYDFEQEITWLSLHMSKSALAEYKHIAWRTVGEIIGRVYKDLENKAPDKFSGLERIGIDETSYQKGHKYITVVVNHDTGGLIWAHEGHSIETLSKFFEALTPAQRAGIKLVSGDGAKWIPACMEKYCPNAERCIDPFHVVGWAMDSLDEVRTEIWREAIKKAKDEKKLERGRPRKDDEKKQTVAQQVKGAKYPLGKAMRKSDRESEGQT